MSGLTKLTVIEAEKICSLCKVSKPFSEFHKNKDRGVGIQPRCKECRNQANRKRPDKRRNRTARLLRDYGVTFEEVKETLKEQHGLCANRACGREISLEVLNGINRAVVDHCHNTGKFRAMLCMSCNFELGKVEKDKNKFLGLIEYLDKFK